MKQIHYSTTVGITEEMKDILDRVIKYHEAEIAAITKFRPRISRRQMVGHLVKEEQKRIVGCQPKKKVKNP